MSDQLKECPCGKTPSKLVITDGGSAKWAFAGGDCCNDWMIEFRTGYNALDSDECMSNAVTSWNTTCRSGLTTTAPARELTDDGIISIDIASSGLGKLLAQYLDDDQFNNVQPRIFALARATLATQPAQVPDGWKLVPIDPTEEMIESVGEYCVGDGDGCCPSTKLAYFEAREIYQTMLTAAPKDQP